MSQMWEYRKKFNDLKNSIMNVPDAEAKVKEATSNEKWGASSTLMQEIAEYTHSYDDYRVVMDTLWKRMDAPGKQWRHVYKALTLLEYLLKNGSDRVIDDAKSRVYMIETLERFDFVDEKGKDEGRNVREKAKRLAKLLKDESAIKEERQNASKNRGKYTGYSNDGGSGGAYDRPMGSSTASYGRPRAPSNGDDEGNSYRSQSYAREDQNEEEVEEEHEPPAPVKKLMSTAPAAAKATSTATPVRKTGANSQAHAPASASGSKSGTADLFGFSSSSNDPFAASSSAGNSSGFGASNDFLFGSAPAPAPVPKAPAQNVDPFGGPLSSAPSSKPISVQDLFAPTDPSVPLMPAASMAQPQPMGMPGMAPMGMPGMAPMGMGMPGMAPMGMPMMMPMGGMPGMAPMGMGMPGMAPMAMASRPMPPAQPAPAANKGGFDGFGDFESAKPAPSAAGVKKSQNPNEVERNLVNLDSLSLTGGAKSASSSSTSASSNQGSRVSMNSMGGSSTAAPAAAPQGMGMQPMGMGMQPMGMGMQPMGMGMQPMGMGMQPMGMGMQPMGMGMQPMGMGMQPMGMGMQPMGMGMQQQQQQQPNRSNDPFF
eukprot:ANDGO_06041.mRNA.1 Clathrin interactor EPSIN 2